MRREDEPTPGPPEETADRSGGVAGGSQGTDGISGGDDHGRKVRSGGSGSPGGQPVTVEHPPGSGRQSGD